MPEWWSYSLSDFMLFSPRTYYRLIERYNQAVWPGQVATLGLGLGCLVLLQRKLAWQGKFISGILAALWAWCAWAFLWKRYTTINWAAAYVLPLFALEIVLLVWIGVVRNRLTFRVRRGFTSIAGMAMVMFSVMAYPLMAPLLGRSWLQAEVFGIAPDPTVIGTAGLLLLTEPPRWILLVVPLAWCLITGLTLWALHSREAVVPAAAILIVLTAAAAAFQEPVRQKGMIQG
jgi:Family of unknown function (DUF6064)